MENFLQQIGAVFSGVVLANLVFALIILIGGWLIALALSALVGAALRRTNLDNRLATVLARRAEGRKIEIEKWISRAVFWLIMLFVLVAFFQQLQLTAITQPLNALLEQILTFIPRILGAAVLVLIAWGIATVVRYVVQRLLRATNLDERMAVQAGLERRPDQVPLSETLANVIYWFIFLLFLPAILSALQLGGLLAPIVGMVDEILAILPNILGAALILLIGWFIARVVRQIVANLLAATGIDGLGTRIGLGTTVGSPTLSWLIGTIVYALILIPAIIAALNNLEIEAISQPATQMLTTFLDALPRIFGAIVILAIAYFVGRLVADLVANILTSLGFDRLVARLGLRTVPVPTASPATPLETTPGAITPEEVSSEPVVRERTPSEVVGYLVLIAIMIFSAIEAANLLGFETLGVILAQFLRYAGQVLVAIIVFGLGLYLANLARNVILATGGPQANFLAQAARLAIIIFSAALALRQTGVAQDIVNLAFGLLLGAIAVAVAIAFGIGGREIAARELERMVQSVKARLPERSEFMTPPSSTPFTARREGRG
jgi:hypothetical protein